MKINYVDFLRKKLEIATDDFIEIYNKYRLLPSQLKDVECKEVWEFLEESRREYDVIWYLELKKKSL